jgi:hypothetical protein
MDTREKRNLLQSIAHTIKDYRQGEIKELTPDHVEKWVNQFDQFDPSYQPLILKELDYIFRTYFLNHSKMRGFLERQLGNIEIFGNNPATKMKEAKFLDYVTKGNSQHELLQMSAEIIKGKYNLALPDCGKNPKRYIYINDCIFTGNTVIRDIENWVLNDKSIVNDTTLYIIHFASYDNNRNYLEKEIERLVQQKNIKIEFIHQLNLNQVLHTFCLSSTNSNPEIEAYINEVDQQRDEKSRKYSLLRNANTPNRERVFTSAKNRAVVEYALFQAGLFIRNTSNAVENNRPLGYHYFKNLGFGSIVVTYINCPNNCPLAFWWGDAEKQSLTSWYPLFPRNVNDNSDIMMTV